MHVSERDGNIGKRGRHRRMWLGGSMLALGVVVAVVLVAVDATTALRALVFLPFMIGSIGIVQALRRTCVMRAISAERELDDRVERVEDPEQVKGHRIEAFNVFLITTLASASATAIVMALP